MCRVSQGSISGFLVFNIFRCDLFTNLEEIEFASYANDNTPFVSECTLENVVSSQESCSASLFEWLSNNQMKTSPEKCDLLMNVNRPATIKIGEHTISNSYCEKMLVLKSIINSIIKKASHFFAKITMCVFICVFQKESY